MKETRKFSIKIATFEGNLHQFTDKILTQRFFGRSHLNDFLIELKRVGANVYDDESFFNFSANIDDDSTLNLDAEYKIPTVIAGEHNTYYANIKMFIRLAMNHVNDDSYSFRIDCNHTHYQVRNLELQAILDILEKELSQVLLEKVLPGSK